MKIQKHLMLGLSLTLLSLTGLAQQQLSFTDENTNVSMDNDLVYGKEHQLKFHSNTSTGGLNNNYGTHNNMFNRNSTFKTLTFHPRKKSMLLRMSSSKLKLPKLNLSFSSQDDKPFFKNRRNVYSSLWAFASLNYLYADLVGMMDASVLAQYQSGVVNGVQMTPSFLTVAAGFMQIPIANVFLPQVIKNEKTLRLVQIASGTIMTLVQSGTLFVGKPTPYYALFSAFEIAATAYITLDSIKWKPNSKKPNKLKI